MNLTFHDRGVWKWSPYLSFMAMSIGKKWTNLTIFGQEMLEENQLEQVGWWKIQKIYGYPWEKYPLWWWYGRQLWISRKKHSFHFYQHTHFFYSQVLMEKLNRESIEAFFFFGWRGFCGSCKRSMVLHHKPWGFLGPILGISSEKPWDNRISPRWTIAGGTWAQLQATDFDVKSRVSCFDPYPYVLQFLQQWCTLHCDELMNHHPCFWEHHLHMWNVSLLPSLHILAGKRKRPQKRVVIVIPTLSSKKLRP